MKIYFAGSIRGGRSKILAYAKIIEHLKKFGKVLTEHVGDKKISSYGEKNFSNYEIYMRDVNLIKKSSVVADVSVPSLGVGYEVAKAEQLRKPVLCLYQARSKKCRLSAMIAGNKNFEIGNYKTIKEACDIINNYLTKKK
jgi:hypothetical protein